MFPNVNENTLKVSQYFTFLHFLKKPQRLPSFRGLFTEALLKPSLSLLLRSTRKNPNLDDKSQHEEQSRGSYIFIGAMRREP